MKQPSQSGFTQRLERHTDPRRMDIPAHVMQEIQLDVGTAHKIITEGQLAEVLQNIRTSVPPISPDNPWQIVVLDFSPLEHVSSAFFSDLLKEQEILKAHHVDLALVGLKPDTLEMLRLCGMQRRFNIVPSDRAARGK